MKFGLAVKEKIARVIGEYFTTNQIVSIFSEANIPTDKSLYAKWRITLDAFKKTSKPEETIPALLEAFSHPLNFTEETERNAFIKKLNSALAYDDYEIRIDGKQRARVYEKGGSAVVTTDEDMLSNPKTSTDYIVDALTFFKDEYNKVRMKGLAYEYALGENIASEQVENGREDYSERLQAIEQLASIGFVTEFKVEERIECDGYYVWDYAVCKINETKLTQEDEAPSTSTMDARARKTCTARAGISERKN